jgi:hypothetical protein
VAAASPSGARRRRHNRGAARRARRAPPSATLPAPGRPGLGRALVLAWWAATALLLILVAVGITRKITWYLAVDQYGYLAFGHDLASGRVFHEWKPIEALASRLPAQTDVLSQTYVWDRGRLYCRYAPGFPIILAAWLLLFGDDGAHYLNPTVYVALLVLVLAFQRRVFRSPWRATAGVALVVLFPTFLHLWGITLVRDLPTHLAGLLGLFLLLPAGTHRLGWRRAGAAGLAFGYAASIRPDAVLYLVPALAVAAWRWRREAPGRRTVAQALGAAALAFLVGLAPFLAYNWAATGNPLRATQGMELRRFLPRAAAAPAPPEATTLARIGYPPGAWRGGTLQAVQGGGLRLENLPRVLPQNLGFLRQAYGDVLLGLAVWGAALALLWRRALFLAAVPYIGLALLFYSCWGRPDTRYLAGVHLLLPMLVVEGAFGTLDLVRRLVRAGRVVDGRMLALVGAGTLAAAALLVEVPQQRSALPMLTLGLSLAIAAALGAAAAWPRRRIATLATPLVGLALVALGAWRANEALGARAAFQRPEMLRARATLARAVEPGAVVITSEDVGRPAENIDYYSGIAHALYFTDLERWRIPPHLAAYLLVGGGLKPYLLIPPDHPGRAQMFRDIELSFSVDLVARIPPHEAMAYFVAAPFHRGIPMELHRLRPLPWWDPANPESPLRREAAPSR